MVRPTGQIHLKRATAEQRERFRKVCDLLKFPIADVQAPEYKNVDCKLVGFHVEDFEMEGPIELAEQLGMTKTMLSRIAWRIGTCMLEARTLEVNRG